jgi:hypothetical protein
MKTYSCPCCGAVLLDWRHFNDAILKESDNNDFECTARTCGKRFHRKEILQNAPQSPQIQKDDD